MVGVETTGQTNDRRAVLGRARAVAQQPQRGLGLARRAALRHLRLPRRETGSVSTKQSKPPDRLTTPRSVEVLWHLGHGAVGPLSGVDTIAVADFPQAQAGAVCDIGGGPGRYAIELRTRL